jgi:uncharacterized protein (TIGR02145 family)
MKNVRLAWYRYWTPGNGVMFHAVASVAVFAVILCGGCSDNGMGTAVGESKVPAVPSVLSSVSAVAASSSSITVGWSPVSTATGYNVYRGESSSGAYSKVGTTTAISYTNAELSSGTVYYYKVSAYNNGGEGARSSFAFAATIPDAPSTVSASAVTRDNITVDWGTVFGAVGYNVYRDTNLDGAFDDKVGTATSTSFSNTGVSSGTVYYYKVTAYNSGGESAMSSHVSVMTVPAAPSGVSVLAAYSDSVTVGWQSVFGADGYIVYRDDIQVGTISSDSTSYTDTGLSSGAAYYYRVSAYNGIGEGTQSAPVEATTVISIVPVVYVDTAMSSSIAIRWTLVSGAVGYNVYRGTSAGGHYDKVYETTSTSYINTGLSSCTGYYYRVSAYNSAGEGGLSDSVYTITAPTPPLRVTAFAESSSEIAVSWGSSSCATGYNVYRSLNVAGPYNRVGTATSTSYTNTGLIWGTTYYYVVSARNVGGESAQSSPPVEATTGSVPDINVTVSAATPSSITLRWPSVPGAEGYYVYRSANGSGYDRIRTTSSITYTDNQRVSGTTYCYTVSAYVGTDKESPRSSEACATPLDTFTDARDGRAYKAVRINNKLWMAENLKYENNGDFGCYDNDETNCGVYGMLYGWVSASEGGGGVNPQGVCPDGWHLPSRYEWGDLAKAFNGTGVYGDGGAAGTKMKARTGWRAASGIPRGTDDKGFSALPGGYGEYSGGGFAGAETSGRWWTSTDDDEGDAYYRGLEYDSERAGEALGDKSMGMSVRCVQD